MVNLLKVPSQFYRKTGYKTKKAAIAYIKNKGKSGHNFETKDALESELRHGQIFDLKAGIAQAKQKRAEITKRHDKIIKEKAHTTYVKVRVDYTVNTYSGGKLLSSRPEYKEEFGKLEQVFGYDDKKFNQFIAQMIKQLKEKILQLLESGDVLVKWDKEQSWTLTKDKFNKTAQDPTTIRMMKAIPINYKFINADLNEAKQDGMCVPEAIYNKYKKAIPTLTIDKIKQLMKDPLTTIAEDKIIGYCVQDNQRFCDYYKISHYALDIDNKLFWKKSYPSHYEALIYYMINEHMYPVTDAQTRDHIVKVYANKTSGRMNTQLQEEKKEQEQVNRFKLPYYANIDIGKLDKYSNCNIFYHQLSLYDLWHQLFMKKNSQYECKFTGNHMTSIKYDNDVMLYANANHRSDKDWTDSIKICKIFGIEFRNQSIQSISKEIFEKYNMKGGRNYIRKHLSLGDRQLLWKRQGSKCAICKDACKEFDVDHIIPLSSGGDNSLRNLQGLCKTCHIAKTSKEASDNANFDNTRSSFNILSQPIFAEKKNGFRHVYCDIHVIKKRLSRKQRKLFGLDINKCRKNGVRYGNDDYCVFSVMDDPKPFDQAIHKDIPVGYYYVRTNNVLPLKGNGWYSYVIIKYCLENKIINLCDIDYVILPSMTLPAEYFNDFIDYIYEKGGEYAKFMINAWIGMMGTKNIKKRKLQLTTSMNEASYHYFTTPSESNIFVHDKDGYYEIDTRSEKLIDDSHVPIFNQILDQEAIELHKITKILESLGGEMVYLNTDNAIAQFKIDAVIDEDLINKYFWSNSKEKKYKIASQPNLCELKEKAQTNVNIITPIKYKITEDPMINDFTETVNKLINSNEGFSLIGAPGTGKTTLASLFMKKIQSLNKKFIALGPTHKSCKVVQKLINNDCKTIHSFVNQIGKAYSKLKDVDYIIIDEISMLQEIFWKKLAEIKKNTNIKFILVGDWAQLGPVRDRCDFDYENSFIVHYLSDGNMMKLTKCRRSDDRLFKMYMNVENVDINKFPHVEYEKGICFHNSVRKQKNDRIMKNKIIGKKYMLVKAHKCDDNSQDTYVYNGLPVIACRTDNKLDICNSDEGIVDSWNKQNIKVKIEDKIITIPTNDFAKYFYPAYVMTIHKCQSITIREPYTIYKWNQLDTRLKYVALSRSSDIKFISIIA